MGNGEREDGRADSGGEGKGVRKEEIVDLPEAEAQGEDEELEIWRRRNSTLVKEVVRTIDKMSMSSSALAGSNIEGGKERLVMGKIEEEDGDADVHMVGETGVGDEDREARMDVVSKTREALREYCGSPTDAGGGAGIREGGRAR
jgi:hypothetical protein